MNALPLEYEQDFHSWIRQHIILLSQRNFDEIDVGHLIEELEDMSKSNIRELENRFVILIAHLLKWQFQSKNKSSSWKGSINEQRVQLLRLLNKAPSLKREIPNAVIDVYADAVFLATDDTGLPKSDFPSACHYTIEQLLDKTFYP